jgi:hypothetical protein
MYSRSAWGKVFKGVFIERKEGEAVAEFKGRGVIVKGVKRESSFEGSSCGVGTLGFLNHTFFNHTDGRHALTLVGTKHCVARKFPFEASKLVQGDGAAHGIQIRTGHGALETTARRHSCIVGGSGWGERGFVILWWDTENAGVHECRPEKHLRIQRTNSQKLEWTAVLFLLYKNPFRFVFHAYYCVAVSDLHLTSNFQPVLTLISVVVRKSK